MRWCGESEEVSSGNILPLLNPLGQKARRYEHCKIAVNAKLNAT